MYSSEYECLKELVYSDDGNKEKECQPFLEHVPNILLGQYMSKFDNITSTRFERESRLPSGDNDVLQGFSVRDDTGRTVNHLVVWEVKAPQCSPFRITTNNRAAPTADLIEVENQLLHYFHDLKSNAAIKDEFEIVNEDNIHLGGIIIGREDKLISGGGQFSLTDERKLALYRRAKGYRETYFWSPAINFKLWDSVLANLKPAIQQNIVPEGDLDAMTFSLREEPESATAETII